jgi:hypothetical protein
MATAVMNLKSFNFQTMTKKGEIIKGINDGGLWALSKHNERKELDFKQETKFIKSKHSNNDNIDLNRSKDNIYYKNLTPAAVKDLEDKQKRKNGVGAFSLVFDFQDLRQDTIKNFGKIINGKNKSNATMFKNLILEFLEEQGISERFEILEMALHLDEKNPHFHLLFSAWDNKKNDWGYNDFFSPKGEPQIVKDKKGEIIYLKENRGKKRGEFKLDENGNKIPKTERIRTSKVQQFQDSWGQFIETKSKNMIKNKKEFSSMLSYTNSVYREFTEQQKEKLEKLRQKEKQYYTSSAEYKKKNKMEFLRELAEFNNEALEVSNRVQQKKKTTTLKANK